MLNTSQKAFPVNAAISKQKVLHGLKQVTQAWGVLIPVKWEQSTSSSFLSQTWGGLYFPASALGVPDGMCQCLSGFFFFFQAWKTWGFGPSVGYIFVSWLITATLHTQTRRKEHICLQECGSGNNPEEPVLTAVTGEQTAEGFWQKMRSNQLQGKQALWCHSGATWLPSTALKRWFPKRAKQTLSPGFPWSKWPAWILGMAEKLQCCWSFPVWGRSRFGITCFLRNGLHFSACL